MRVEQPKPLKQVKIKNKEVYDKLDKLIEKKLDASDLILLVLHAGQVKGATAMQKQVFIAWREMYHERSLDAGYYPWLYGPYSKLVDDLLSALKATELIDFKGKKNEGMIYTIRNRGRERIQQRIKKLKIPTEELIRRKQMWNDWTSRGYLQYVYRKHPEYAVKSMVPSYKWE